MADKIKIKVERDGKTISDREVELKILNLDAEADLKDLYMGHFQDIENKKTTSKVYRKSLDVIRLVTDYNDNEIKGLSDEERFQIFSIIGKRLFEKKS